MQDDRYAKYIGMMAIVPMTYGRHVPILSAKVRAFVNHFFYDYVLHFFLILLV